MSVLGIWSSMLLEIAVFLVLLLGMGSDKKYRGHVVRAISSCVPGVAVVLPSAVVVAVA